MEEKLCSKTVFFSFFCHLERVCPTVLPKCSHLLEKISLKCSMGIKKAKLNGDFKIIDEVANKFMQKITGRKILAHSDES
jgi:hypothetical protein